jgi:hypothetical protein
MIKTAKSDVKKIVFKDKLFDKFCNLSAEIVPSEEECTKIETSVYITELWRLFERI